MSEYKAKFLSSDIYQSVTTVTTGFLFPEPRAILIQHSCTILDCPDQKCIITFPDGTQRQELFLRTMSERYRILLPDGLEMRQVYDRCQEISQLFIVL